MTTGQVLVGPSRKQLQNEIAQLKRANEIIMENLRLREEVDLLREKIKSKEEPATLTADEVGKIMRFGTNKMYQFVKDLEKLGCPVIWYGREPRIPREGFFNWLNQGGAKSQDKKHSA